MHELESEEEVAIWILGKRKNKIPLRVGNVYREQNHGAVQMKTGQIIEIEE